MRKFDYSFLNNGLLPSNLINLTSNIASLKTMAGVRKEEYAKVFTKLEAVAKVQSVKSSNAIEGIITSDERIAAYEQARRALRGVLSRKLLRIFCEDFSLSRP